MTISLLFGPPFPTGDPHYGHLINFILKDTLIGFLNIKKGTDIRFDVHGLPTEQKVQSFLKITDIKEIKETYGIKTYNEECKKYIESVMERWPVIFRDVCPNLTTKGKSTMDYDYMKKLWKLFKILYDKGLIYESLKVQPYSAACETCISNFEAKSNYKTVTENSIYVLFKHLPQINRDFTVNNNTYFIVWTTTPFTLPSNASLCINKNIKYVLFFCDKKQEEEVSFFISSSSFFEKQRKKNSSFVFEREISIEELIGESYDPPFADLTEKRGAPYKIIEDSFVTEETGTGIVHISPFFGEDDYRVYKDNFSIEHLKDSDPTDSKMCFTRDIENLELKAKECRDCNGIITKELKNRNLLFKEENITHELPFCWRTDKPLYYKIISTLSLNVQLLKEKMLQAFDKINFVNNSGRERMRHCIETAPDWCISRTRIWGTPIPYWKDENTGEIIVLDELYSTEKEKDLHLDKIPPFFSFSREKEEGEEDGVDSLQIIKYKHCEFVFDCWFESGAQFYCEEEDSLVSDLIIEGIDQTRGWFYTLLVLGTAFHYNKEKKEEDFVSPYRNVIVNGIVMDANGVKFSKKLQNYRGVSEILENYGIDAVRLYFLDSPAARGVNFNFNEDGIRTYSKNIIIPLKNIAGLYCEYNQYHNKNSDEKKHLFFPLSFNDLDKYILNTYSYFKEKVLQEITQKYNVTNSVKYLSKFVYDFSNTYCIFNRKSIKNTFSSLTVIRFILKDLNESILKHLTPILFLYIKSNNCIYNKEEEREDIQSYIGGYEYDIEKTIEIIHKILAFRTAMNIPLKKYLNRIIIPEKKNSPLLLLDTKLIKEVAYIFNEVEKGVSSFEKKAIFKPLYKEIGRDFGSESKKVISSILEGKNIENIDSKYYETSFILPSLSGYEIVDNDFYVDVSSTAEIENFYMAKLLTTEIQKMRKENNLKVYNTVLVYVTVYETTFYNIFSNEAITAYIKDILKTENVTFCKKTERKTDGLLAIDSCLDCSIKFVTLKEAVDVKIELFF